MDLGKYTRKVLKRVLVFYVQTEDCSLGMILNIVCEVYGGEVRLNILSLFCAIIHLHSIYYIIC
jgi:hypothetical protein